MLPASGEVVDAVDEGDCGTGESEATSTTATKLTTIIDIRDWLREQDRLSHSTTAYGITGLEQFAIDWIEEEIDRAERYLESEQITVDDITFAGAIHYRADCVLEVLRKDCNCYRFFAQLAELVKLPTRPTTAQVRG